MRRALLAALVVAAAALLAGCSSTVGGTASFGAAGVPVTPTATAPTGSSGAPTSAPSTAPNTPPSTAPTSAAVPTTSAPAPSTGAESATVAAQRRVCGGMTHLVLATNAALNKLPADASLQARQGVAASFASGNRQMVAILRSAPVLGSRNLVRLRGNEVIAQTGRVATLLRSGDPFNDAGLIGAQGRLSKACAK